jgi:hypothetical protein
MSRTQFCGSRRPKNGGGAAAIWVAAFSEGDDMSSGRFLRER